MPPIGLILFLGFTGILDKRSVSGFAEWITPFQDFLTPALIFGFGLLSGYAVATRKAVVFRSLAITLIIFASTSLGGCIMGLSNLKNIGQ
jgi:hypothetical protein